MHPCSIRFPSWWPPFTRPSSRISPSGPFLLVFPFANIREMPLSSLPHPSIFCPWRPLTCCRCTASNTSAHSSPRCVGWACHDAAVPSELVPLLGILLVPPVCGPICRWTVFL